MLKSVLIMMFLFGCRLNAVVSQYQPIHLTDLAHAFVTHFFDDRMDQATVNFDSTLVQRTFEQRLHFIRQSILMTLGTLWEIGRPTLMEGEEEKTVVVPLSFENGKLEVRIRFTPSHRISSYAFNPEGVREASGEPSYAVPERFLEWNVSIDRPGLPFLSGRLAVPRGEGPFPVILWYKAPDREAWMPASAPIDPFGIWPAVLAAGGLPRSVSTVGLSRIRVHSVDGRIRSRMRSWMMFSRRSNY